MRTHEHYEMLVSRYKDNDLNAEEILEMKKHLSNCKSCQKFMKDIDFVSSILLGKNPITVNKVKSKFYPYIISIAAALLIFAAVSIALNYNNYNIGKEEGLIVSNAPVQTIIEDADYIPLSTYFYEDIDANNDNTAVLSAYISYVGMD